MRCQRLDQYRHNRHYRLQRVLFLLGSVVLAASTETHTPDLGAMQLATIAACVLPLLVRKHQKERVIGA